MHNAKSDFSDKKLIATDFDGTFIRNGVISAADRAAVERWRKTGRLFGFVTGRGIDFIETARDYGVEADYFLLYNGALLITPDGKVHKEYLLNRETFARLAAFFRNVGDICSFSEPGTEAYYHQYYARMPTQEQALAVAAQAEELFGEELAVFVNGEHINIGIRGSSKAQGVTDALAYYGLPEDAALVFGDDYNDLEMLKAHDGWAVETGRPAVLEKAPHVCRDPAQVINRILDGE